MYRFYNDVCFYFLCLSSPFGTVKVIRFSSTESFSDRKLNMVDTLGSQKYKFPSSFQKNREKHKKNYGKPLIFTQNRFSSNVLILQ